MAAQKGSSPVSEAVTWRKTGAEAVILNLETSEYFSANETGTFIWELLSAGHSPEEIPPALAEEFDIAPEKAAEDTAEFLEELTSLKLLCLKAGK